MLNVSEFETSAPAVVHQSLAPVHVIGHARSGTSVFVRMLRKYLRIGFGTESQFIIRFYENLSRYGDLADDSSRRRLVEDICQERWFERCDHRFGGFETSPDEILADVATPSYAGVLDAVFRQLAKQMRMERWGDKTPEYIDHLPVLFELFPDARFIHVVRDGRDVALSGFEQPFGEKNVFTAARAWKAAMDKVQAFAGSIPQRQFLEVRYEDFLAEPGDCFEKLIEFLEIDPQDGQLAKAITESVRGELKVGNTEKWRRRLSERQIQRFDRLAADALSHYGYAVSVDSAQPGNRLVNSYWQCDDFIRRVSHPGFLQNAAYRARLRVRDVFRGLTSRPPAQS